MDHITLRIVWPREARRKGKGELERLVFLARVIVVIVCVGSVDVNGFHLSYGKDLIGIGLAQTSLSFKHLFVQVGPLDRSGARPC